MGNITLIMVCVFLFIYLVFDFFTVSETKRPERPYKDTWKHKEFMELQRQMDCLHESIVKKQWVDVQLEISEQTIIIHKMKDLVNEYNETNK